MMHPKRMIQQANGRLSTAVAELDEAYQAIDDDGMIALEKLEELGELVGYLEEIEYRLEKLAPSNS